jgi:Icc protein
VTRVFAVDDTAMQLDWSMLSRGEHVVEVGNRRVVVVGDDAPAAVWIDDLPADTALDVVVDGRRAATARTLATPPGRALSKIATIGDLHVGDGWTFGVWPTLRHAGGDDDPIVLRCLRAALAEIAAWGPDLLVVKGDLTHHGREDEWETVAALLGNAGVPAIATIGNHDVKRGPVTGRHHIEAAGIELVVEGVTVRDLPGVRVVVADATIPGRHPGTVRHVGPAIVDAAASAPGATLVTLHHQLHATPVLTHWPPGILAPGSTRFLRELGEVNPSTVVTSGHTHRHRVRRVGPVVVSEVGSVKDYPGTWAGYVVHEGGLRQVVRRTADPDVIAWTEETKRALFGAWGWWSPGSLHDRCYSVAWNGR